MSVKNAHTSSDIYRSARRSAANCNSIRVSCTCTSTGESYIGCQYRTRAGRSCAKGPNWIVTVMQRITEAKAPNAGGGFPAAPGPQDPAANRFTDHRRCHHQGGVGIVIYGIVLRKDLGKVKKWLSAANESLGKIQGIRWLRKQNLLEKAGKTTSSVVVYLEKEVDVEKVKLSGQWHRSARYESERRRR
ncbi:hypothetical protein BDZ91DRAFT_803533 [Kalaharituber pfeilii]|nr:hypothetical protein BDZ91DRAFT_803533 [Kalaharituber pfeilii]